MRVTVVGVPASVAAIRLERVGHASKLGHPYKKICDYLLVIEHEHSTHALFVELKKTWTTNLKPREQLRRSLPILEYLCSVCEVEHGTIERRARMSVTYAIVFERFNERLDKQRVRADPKARVSREEYEGIAVRTFVGTRVSVRTLIGR